MESFVRKRVYIIFIYFTDGAGMKQFNINACEQLINGHG